MLALFRPISVTTTSMQLSGQAYKLIELHGVIKTNYEKAEECLNTNYHGVRRVTEALLPLL